MKTLGRVLTAMVTPFKENGDVDYDQAKKLASALLDSGSEGVVTSTARTGVGEADQMATEKIATKSRAKASLPSDNGLFKLLVIRILLKQNSYLL